MSLKWTSNYVSNSILCKERNFIYNQISFWIVRYLLRYIIFSIFPLNLHNSHNSKCRIKTLSRSNVIAHFLIAAIKFRKCALISLTHSVPCVVPALALAFSRPVQSAPACELTDSLLLSNMNIFKMWLDTVLCVQDVLGLFI